MTSETLKSISRQGLKVVVNNSSTNWEEFLPENCEKPMCRTLLILQRVGIKIDWNEHLCKYMTVIAARNECLSKLGKSSDVILVMLKHREYPGYHFRRERCGESIKQVKRILCHPGDLKLTFGAQECKIWEDEHNRETARELVEVFLNLKH
jgi:hypothetical protein